MTLRSRTAQEKLQVLAFGFSPVLELPVPLVGPGPPMDSPPPPPPKKKGVEFEHLGGANKSRNKSSHCYINDKWFSTHNDDSVMVR